MISFNVFLDNASVTTQRVETKGKMYIWAMLRRMLRPRDCLAVR